MLGLLIFIPIFPTRVLILLLFILVVPIVLLLTFVMPLLLLLVPLLLHVPLPLPLLLPAIPLLLVPIVLLVLLVPIYVPFVFTIPIVTRRRRAPLLPPLPRRFMRRVTPRPRVAPPFVVLFVVPARRATPRPVLFRLLVVVFTNRTMARRARPRPLLRDGGRYVAPRTTDEPAPRVVRPRGLLGVGTGRVVIWRVVPRIPPGFDPGVVVLLAQFLDFLLEVLDVWLKRKVSTLRVESWALPLVCCTISIS